MNTLNDSYANSTGPQDFERRKLEAIASAWTPKAQAEHANYQRMQAEGITLSPHMTMQLGYLESAKTAHDTLTNGK